MNDINTTEESLRLEIEELKRQLEEQKRRSAGHGDPVSKPPTYRSLLVVVMLLALLAVAGYYRVMCRGSIANRFWLRRRRRIRIRCPW